MTQRETLRHEISGDPGLSGWITAALLAQPAEAHGKGASSCFWRAVGHPLTARCF